MHRMMRMRWESLTGLVGMGQGCGRLKLRRQEMLVVECHFLVVEEGRERFQVVHVRRMTYGKGSNQTGWDTGNYDWTFGQWMTARLRRWSLGSSGGGVLGSETGLRRRWTFTTVRSGQVLAFLR